MFSMFGTVRQLLAIAANDCAMPDKEIDALQTLGKDKQMNIMPLGKHMRNSKPASLFRRRSFIVAVDRKIKLFPM